MESNIILTNTEREKAPQHGQKTGKQIPEQFISLWRIRPLEGSEVKRWLKEQDDIIYVIFVHVYLAILQNFTSSALKKIL